MDKAQLKEKAFQRQRESIQEETEKAGLLFLENQKLETSDKIFAGSVAAIFGGKMKPTDVDLNKYRVNDLEVSYYQPYRGFFVLPGEHHVILPVGIHDSIAFAKGLVFPKWKTRPEGPKEFLKRVSADSKLKKLVKKSKWKWAVGLSIIKLKWTVQIRPISQNKSHLVMKTGRYGGLTAYKVGMEFMKNLLEYLPQTLQMMAVEFSPNSEKEFIFPTAF